MRVLAGDFGENTAGSVDTTLGGKVTGVSVLSGTFKATRIAAAEIASVDALTDENKSSALKGCGWAVAGTLLAGPIAGLIAGLVGAKGKTSHTVLVTLTDGRRLLAACSPLELQQLLTASMLKK